MGRSNWGKIPRSRNEIVLARNLGGAPSSAKPIFWNHSLNCASYGPMTFGLFSPGFLTGLGAPHVPRITSLLQAYSKICGEEIESRWRMSGAEWEQLRLKN